MVGKTSKVATVFHESFALSLPSISQILQVACESESGDENGKSRNLSYDAIKQGTTLGNNYVKAMRRYARAVGLLDDRDGLTPFGKLVSRSDPHLQRMRTLWAVHYHLCASHHSGPGFWGHLASECFTPYRELVTEDVAQLIAAYLQAQGDPVLAARTLRTTATVFLGSYHKSDGLGALGILSSQGDGKCVAGEPDLPGTRVVAYVIADYWAAQWKNRKQVNLSAMTEPGGPASLLMMSSGDINSSLGDMAGLGLVQVQRRIPPYSVVRLWQSAEAVMEQLYDG